MVKTVLQDNKNRPGTWEVNKSVGNDSLSVGNDSDVDVTLLASKEDSLLGKWGLELAKVDAEEFEFTYTFGPDGSFNNRVGGNYLRRIEELNEIDGIDIDIGKLELIDSGFINFNGTWSTQGDSLDLRFETLKIEVAGELPILKRRIVVPVHEENLTGSGENQVVYSYHFANEQLVLNGESLTLGIGLDGTVQPLDLDPLAVESLKLISEFVHAQISARDEDEFAMTRVE